MDTNTFKILLPALCLFSGFLLLISDNFAEKLYLKEFRQKNGFAFGLIFTITLTLILVYIIFFLSKPILKKYKEKLAERELRKNIEKLKGNEKFYVYALHNISTHAHLFPSNDPTINLLYQKGLVYTYNQQADILTFGKLSFIYCLNPLAEEAITKIICKKADEIEKLSQKIIKVKSEEKRKDLQSVLVDKEKDFKNLTSLSLQKFFKGEKQWIN